MKQKHLLAFIFFLLLLNLSSVHATDYYWKGGSGDYNDPTMWWLYSYNSGTTAIQAPISSDDVYFTAAAFATPGAVVSINANANCGNMFWDNAITVANRPRVVGGTPSTYLDIYGSLELCTNMDFDYAGNLRMRSTDTLVTVNTRANPLNTANFFFFGTDSTEFRLMSNFVDGIRSVGIYDGVQLQRGYLNLNGYDMNLINFNLGRSNATHSFSRPANSIGINMKGATITIHGIYWIGSSRAVFHTFETDSSTLNYIGRYGSTRLVFHDNFAFDTVRLAGVVPTTPFSARSCSINQLYSNNTVNLSGRFNINDWYVEGTEPVINVRSRLVITVDSMHLPNTCGYYTPITNQSATGTLPKFRKKTPNSSLILNKVLLSGINVDVSGGRQYVANNSIDAGGNAAAWQFNASTSRDMYFRATTNNLWSNASNWEIFDGTSFLPNSGNCLPTAEDNVFFDALSFANGDSIIVVDTIGYCHDMRWLNTVRPNATIHLNRGVRMFGSLELSNVMKDIPRINGGFALFGKDPDTITTNTVGVYPTVSLKPYSNYYVADTFVGYHFNAEARSNVRAENITFKAEIMQLHGNGLFNNVYAWLNAFRGGMGMTYQGTTTFELGKYYAGTSIDLWDGNYNDYKAPNLIINKFVSNGGGSNSLIVEGDLVLRKGWSVGGAVIDVTGSMAQYSGDMHVSAGKTYSWKSGSLTVADTLHAIGDCLNVISWLPTQGLNVDIGYLNVQHNFITQWNNIGATTLTAQQSIDGGSNNNVIFPPATGTTYYWRASSSDATDYEGNWTDISHWTNDPNDVVGGSVCLPTLADTIIFDALSHSTSSNGCTINAPAYCKALISKTAIVINGNGRLNIGNSLIIEDVNTVWNHNNSISFVGNESTGIIDTRNVYINGRGFVFDNNSATWNIVSRLRARGGIVQRRGNLITNGNNLSIGGYYHYAGHFDFQNSEIGINFTVYPSGFGRRYTMWNQMGGTINATGSTIINNYYSNSALTFKAGNRSYNRVILPKINSRYLLQASGGHYSKLDIRGHADLLANNTIDTLVLHGGNFYKLKANTTQTLSSPHGHIQVRNVGPGSFVNIESLAAGQRAYFHKEYGTAFCVDWIKVKDNRATKGNTPPPAWAGVHHLLQFETGINSDNIGNTATGIWNFEMPPILQVTSQHDSIIDFCVGDTTVYIPITMTGTYPYSIINTWTDSWGNSGIDTTIVVDNDSNVLTPFTYNLAVRPYTNTTYSIDVAALRCGGRNFGAPITTVTAQLPQNNLVQNNSFGDCILTNNTVWGHFVDDATQRPMASILDKTNPADATALGHTTVRTTFDATVQYWNGKPYLPRHWKIDVSNNSAGKVRLYFTQADLNKLQTVTFNQNIDPATDLILYKFPDTPTVGTPVVLPFTVIPLTGRAANPFASTTDVFAIEFESPSFSGFLLQPTDPVILPLALLEFEATKLNQQVVLNWLVEDAHEGDYYQLQRSIDGVQFESFALVDATNATTYQYTDTNPFTGTSYYRLKLVDKYGQITYSAIRAVTFESNNIIAIFPNPVQQQILNIKYNSVSETALSIQLYNSVGQLIEQKNWEISTAGTHKTTLATRQLAAGGYTLRITDQQGQLIASEWIVIP